MRICLKLNIRCICSTEYVQCFRSKMLFLGTFWKITTYWSPLDERVCSSFAEKRKRWVWDLDPGIPLKNRSKTAQILLEKPFKNHRKKWAVFQRFLSKIWAVWAVFPKKPPKPPKPLKPLKSCWKTAQTAQILSGFWAGSRPGMRLCLQSNKNEYADVRD